MKKNHSIMLFCLISCIGLAGCGAAGPELTETDPANVSSPDDETAETSSASESSGDAENVPENASVSGTAAFTQEAEEDEIEPDYFVSDRIRELIRSTGYAEGESFIDGDPEISYEYSYEDFEHYSFEYAGEIFEVIHEYDNWKIFDSYKIRNTRDMEKICQSLTDIYPVHGRDLSSYRNAEDMTYEWLNHNIAYELLDDDDPYKQYAANVDLDPGEQNKSLWEIYLDRADITK